MRSPRSKELWVWLAFVPLSALLVCGAMIGLDAWSAWEPNISLEVRADRSAVVCALCAVPGLVLLAICTLKLHRIEKGTKP